MGQTETRNRYDEKAVVDPKGYLWLSRKSTMQQVKCPLNKHNYCGDWCALFCEPFSADTQLVEIELCSRVINIKRDNFVDQR